MIKTVLFALVLFLLAVGCAVKAQIQVKVAETKTLVSSDDKDFSGQLVNPLPCPADTNWIAFIRVIREKRELHFYNRKQKTFKSISASPQAKSDSVDFFATSVEKGYDDQLDWCPVKKDGKIWFAFVGTGAGDNPDVYISNLTDLKPLRMTDTDGTRFNEDQPKWSPDGNDLVYCSSRTGKGDLYLIRNVLQYVDTKPSQEALIRLTFSDEEDLYPVWNPDSLSGLLAYTAYQKGARTGQMTHTINYIDLYSGNRVDTLTDDEDFNFFRASWDPVSGAQIACYATKEVVQNLQTDDPSLYEWSIALYKLELKDGHLVTNPVLGAKPFLAGKVVANVTSGPTWLPGSKGLLTVKALQEKYNPLSSVNINNWKMGAGNVEEILSLSAKFPREPKINNNVLYVSVLEGDKYQIIESRLTGKLIFLPYTMFALSRPKEAKIWYAKAKTQKPGEVGEYETGGGNFMSWLTGPVWGSAASIFNNKLTIGVLASAAGWTLYELLKPKPPVENGGVPPIPPPPRPPY